MEKKTFKIIKNLLFPVKSTIEIGPEGILNKKKFVRWEDIDKFSYAINSINGAMNYIVGYTEKDGKGHAINFIVTLTGSKKKKAMFAEIYQMLHEGFTKHHIKPLSEKYFGEIQAGKEVNLAGTTLSKKGIQGKKGMLKKQDLFIPAEDIKLVHRDGSGGFDVASIQNPKEALFFTYQGGHDSRILLAILEKMKPEFAMLYK